MFYSTTRVWAGSHLITDQPDTRARDHVSEPGLPETENPCKATREQTPTAKQKKPNSDFSTEVQRAGRKATNLLASQLSALESNGLMAEKNGTLQAHATDKMSVGLLQQ